MRKAFFLAFISTASVAQAQDSVLGMCTDWDYSEKICACAVDVLHTQIGDPAYSDYEALGQVYRGYQQNGMAMAEAWDAAIAKTGTEFLDHQHNRDILFRRDKCL